MPAMIYDLYIEQGATFSQEVTVYEANGTPYNLTGANVTSMMRKKYTDANATANFAIAANANLTTGNFTMGLSAANTANIASGSYVYDVEIAKANAVVRVLQGAIVVSPEATK